MFDFETFYKKHDEPFIWSLLDSWERDRRVRHPRPLTLEERWEHFVRVTDNNQARVAA